MKSAMMVLMFLGLVATQANAFPFITSADQAAAGKNTFATTREKLGYSLGLEMGNSFKQLQIDLDPYAYMLGMKDALSGNRPQMAQQDMKDTLISFKREMMAKTPGYEALKERNQKEGEAFLAANQKKPGVVTLKDGLQYKVITEGKGNQPTEKELVAVNYVGTFINGKVFDSSYKNGKPMIFQADSMIPGWTEALKLMKEGSTWEIYVPSSLAYNELGSQPWVGPDQTLIYRIKLLEVQKKEDA